MCFEKNCYFCRKTREQLLKRAKLGIIFLIGLFASMLGVGAVSGNSTFFGLNPYCLANQTSFYNCSEQPIKLNCYVPNFQFVQFTTFIFNGTTYLANQLPVPYQNNWSVSTTLSQKYQTANYIYNWSSVVITDTANNIAIYPQDLIINHTCPDCFPHVIQINSSCGSDDTKNVSYSDTSNCTFSVPPTSLASCDFCKPNWQCNSFNPSTCGLQTKFRDCLSVIDTNSCYSQTGLVSDSFQGQLDDFIMPCTFNDFRTNTTLLSTLQSNLVISQYPYVETNSTIDMEVSITLANSRVLISNVQMQIGGATIKFDQDNDSISYKTSIQIHDNGDYPFVIVGRDNTTLVFHTEGIFFARSFVNVSIQLFEDRNETHPYVNNLATVIALKNDENFKPDTFTNDLVNSLEPLNKANLLTRKLIKLNQSSYYNYRNGKRAFHTPYIDGKSMLHLPVENSSVWEVRLLNSESFDEYAFDGYNYAVIKTKNVANSNDVLLTNGKVDKNLNIKMLVSKWDVRFWQSATKWIILGIVALLFIIAGIIVFATTGQAVFLIVLLTALLFILPVLYVVLNWFLN